MDELVRCDLTLLLKAACCTKWPALAVHKRARGFPHTFVPAPIKPDVFTAYPDYRVINARCFQCIYVNRPWTKYLIEWGQHFRCCCLYRLSLPRFSLRKNNNYLKKNDITFDCCHCSWPEPERRKRSSRVCCLSWYTKFFVYPHK
jgi:hypothetical protein